MTAHLPECLQIVSRKAGPCICWLLRACEARVRDAARDAVATAPLMTGGYATKQADLAAIDALRATP